MATTTEYVVKNGDITLVSVNEFLNGHYNILKFTSMVILKVSVNEFLNGHYNLSPYSPSCLFFGFSERIPKWPLQPMGLRLKFLEKSFSERIPKWPLQLSVSVNFNNNDEVSVNEFLNGHYNCSERTK